MLRIANSKPSLSFTAPPSSTATEGLTVRIPITITDPDTADQIGVGYHFSGTMQPDIINYELICAKSDKEQRCDDILIVQIQPIHGVKDILIEMTPTDGHTVGEKKTTTITVQESSQSLPCDPSIGIPCPQTESQWQ
jgi:hypothetical protein